MNVFEWLQSKGSIYHFRLDLIDWQRELSFRTEAYNVEKLRSILLKYSRYISEEDLSDIVYDCIDDCYKVCNIDLDFYNLDIHKVCRKKSCVECCKVVINTLLKGGNDNQEFLS